MDDILTWMFALSIPLLLALAFYLNKLRKWMKIKLDTLEKRKIFWQNTLSIFLSVITVLLFYVPIPIALLYLTDEFWGTKRCDDICSGISLIVGAGLIFITPVYLVFMIKHYIQRKLFKNL